MELRFFITVFFLLIITAPLARQVVTIIGSISGVSPTATEIANKKASSQLFLVSPFIRKTTGTIIIINFISSHETVLTPLSKAVFPVLSDKEAATCPSIVLLPVTTVTAAAL